MNRKGSTLSIADIILRLFPLFTCLFKGDVPVTPETRAATGTGAGTGTGTQARTGTGFIIIERDNFFVTFYFCFARD